MFHHITYIATGILTQVHATMWAKDIPTRPHVLLHGAVRAIQLKVGIQSTIGAHQENEISYSSTSTT